MGQMNDVLEYTRSVDDDPLVRVWQRSCLLVVKSAASQWCSMPSSCNTYSWGRWLAPSVQVELECWLAEP